MQAENTKTAVAQEDIYDEIANLMLNEEKTASETQAILVDKGMDKGKVAVAIKRIELEIQEEKESSANNDILIGALFCFGGIAATIAEIGYIFWGAIVFGGIQFVRGLVKKVTK